jgi:hypothetical protein
MWTSSQPHGSSTLELDDIYTMNSMRPGMRHPPGENLHGSSSVNNMPDSWGCWTAEQHRKLQVLLHVSISLRLQVA